MKKAPGKNTTIVAFLALFLFSLAGCKLQIIEYNNIADYGIITGNGTDKRAEEVFEELFPPKIMDNFCNTQYHYKAMNGIDSRAFEIALEFTIEDEARYWEYVRSVAPEEQFSIFPYQNEYLFYSVSKSYMILDDRVPCTACPTKAETHYHIDCANLEMIIINPTEKRIVLAAMGVSDGGGVDTDDLRWFFDRFCIDPVVFSKNNPI